MSANPNSYLSATLAAVHEVHPARRDVALRFDGINGPMRFRISLDEARHLAQSLHEVLAHYDRNTAQSPSTSIITKESAIAAFDGSVAALAEALGITPAAVYQWRPGKPIPALQAIRLRFELKPEIFGDHKDESVRAA